MRDDLRASIAAVEHLLGESRDILEGRVDEPEAPEWCKRRGWTEFLLSLDGASLESWEERGFQEEAALGAPPSLRAFMRDLARATYLPRLAHSAAATFQPPRGAGLRKVQQLAGLMDALAGLVRASQRVVDVGAGRGALSRLLATHYDVQVLGVERNLEVVKTAAAMARKDGARGASFEARDVFQQGLDVLPTDLVLGLHACGELGDQIVSETARAGASLVLVSCCPQKVRSEVRQPLSEAGASLSFSKWLLGLANLTMQPAGVEVSLQTTMQSRTTRHGLRRLLRGRGLTLLPGQEMQGVNRKRARDSLFELAEAACEERGLAPPSVLEVSEAERAAEEEYALIRRLSLPRSALARVLEVALGLDRAAFLEERGLQTRLCTFVERAATPRNIALFASADGACLPRADG